VAKTKAKRRPVPRSQARAPETPARPRRRYSRLIWTATVVVAAGGAFLVAKQQAQGPNEAVAPPATGLPRTPDYHALSVDPADPQHILLGTHVGIYESTDGGRTWKFAGLEGDDAMNFARTSANTVWMAGHMVFKKSADGGRTWNDVDPRGLPSLDIHGFTVDPKDPSLVYAAVAGEGFYGSTDGGASFGLLSKEVGPGVFGLAVSAEGRIFAADPGEGVYASNDGGLSWDSVTRERTVGVAVSPDDPDTVLAAGQHGVLRSRDGGRTWRTVLSLDDGAGPVAWAPSEPKIAYVVGFDRKLYGTADGGASWQPVAG
jgi:photosystem II stability/assembly factor-like uncharacterized protein